MRKPTKSQTQIALIAMSGVVTGAALTAVAGYTAFRVPSHLKKYLPKKTK